ncbi:MAG: Rpn family recombination-promoting nuclease/putative transposase [Lachnospiraceae bacterium]|nr:Rpn family recombination-promoting nuclease/putative transposase [Lachnospiraceae bacterium]
MDVSYTVKEFIKKWRSLGLSNDFIFSKIMRDPELCKEMLEILLNIKILKIEYPEDQKTIDISYDGKSVRLDIYVADANNTVYDVEIQTTDTKELPKRSRYYQGMIDLNMIEKGALYKSLNPSYVIFICTFDLFGKDLYKYTFENICREDREVYLGDEAKKIFFNTNGSKGDVSESAKAFLKFVGDGTPSDDAFVKKLQEKLAKVKENVEWRREYMTLLMRDQENIEKGIEQGREQEKTEMIKKLLKKGVLSETEIAEIAGITLDKVKEIKNNI